MAASIKLSGLKKIHPFFLSALTGLLLFAAWPVSPLTFLIFIAFVPLLWLERQGMRRAKFFGWVYLSMLIWNIGATWWVWNSTAPGAVGAILANSLLMCVPWTLFHFVKKRMGDTIGYLSLVVFWLGFEYFHLQNWGLSWPWLTLGNVFATHPNWVQWYEFTGTSGGGLWILAMNVLLFRLLWAAVQRKAAHPGATRQKMSDRRVAAVATLVLILPLLLSGLLKPAVADKTSISNIVIVQPNIDPYEKISVGTFDAQLTKLLRLSESAIDSNTVLVVWPETALYLENHIDEAHMKENYFLNPLWDFLRHHPRINLLTGMESFRFFKDKHSPTAFKIPDAEEYVESYNAAVILDSSGPVSFYHKSRLVPGVETLPPFLHFLDSWFEKFGGTTEGYTGQTDRTPLSTTDHSYRIATAVCYESIYGEFMSRYVRNGADIIAIITNDGWWGNTQGHKQHENYARLRAIETRRWVIRSANTGISCVIDPAGKIVESRPWDQATTIRMSVPTEQGMTFYARHGDCISWLAIALIVLFFAWNLITFIKTRNSRG
jgi:apolipoprotein N-acyltransferase